MKNISQTIAKPLFALVLTTVIFGGCSREPEALNFEYRIIQKPVSIKIAPSLKAQRENILRLSRKEMERIAEILDEQNPKSDVSMINRLGPGVTFPINSEIHRMIRFCTEFEERSEGLFTALIYPLGYMWGFHGNPNPVGISPEIAQASLDSLQTSTFRLTEKTIEMNSPFTRLDFGGVAEGYITDLTVIRLRVQNLSGLMVRVGDSARALGGQDDGQPYTLPIPHPFDLGKIIGHVELKNRIAASFSNIHRKESTIDGKTIGHIINPNTAMPVTNTVQSIGIATSATKSDALATSLVVGGVEKANRLVKRFSQQAAAYGIVIPNRQPLEIHLSKGAEQYFKVAPEYANALQYLSDNPSDGSENDLFANGLERKELAAKLRNQLLSNKKISVAPIPTSVTVKTNDNASADAPTTP